MSSPSLDQPNLERCWHTIGINGDRSCPQLTTVIHCRNCPVYSQGGRELLDRQPPPGYQQEWTHLLAETTENPTVSPNSREVQETRAISLATLPQETAITAITKENLFSVGSQHRHQDTTKPLGQDILSVVIFRLQKEWVALPANLFQEVTELSVVHTLPHRSNEIFLGLVSIRGEIQLCVSLSHLLGLEDSQPLQQTVNPLVYQRLVVMEREGNRWVFPVDEVYGVQRFSAHHLRPAPVVISKAANTYTQGVLEWQATHVNYLDEELLFNTLNRRVL